MADVEKLLKSVGKLYLKDINKVRKARKFLNKLELELVVIELEKGWEQERTARV